MNFCPIDIAMAIVVFISLLFGWIRGATREVLSLISWIGAIYLSVALFPAAKDIARSHIDHNLIADFVTASILFILFLTVLSLLNHLFSNLVKKSILNVADKALGGVFGIVRGAVILIIADFIVAQNMLSEMPKWMENSQLRPIVNSVSNFLILILPENIQERAVAHMSQIKKQNLVNFVKEGVLGSSTTDFETESDKIKGKATAERIVEKEDLYDITDEESPMEMMPSSVNKVDTQSAMDLATLKPKKKAFTDSYGKEPSTKEKNDMSRLLDQYKIEDGDQ